MYRINSINSLREFIRFLFFAKKQKLKIIIATVFLVSVSNIYAQNIGIDYIPEADIYHIWNTQDDFYINATSGLQITNQYQDYWSHNIFCVNYTVGPKSHSYCTDELTFTYTNFTDNNLVAWLEGTTDIAGVEIKLQYEIWLNDEMMRLRPQLNNTGNKDITDLVFWWKVADIHGFGDTANDIFRYHNSTGWHEYLMNDTSLNLNIDNITNRTFYVTESPEYEQYALKYKISPYKWVDSTQSSMDYDVHVTSEDGQYNAPITTNMYIGTIPKDDHAVHTYMWWRDPDYTLTHSSTATNDTDIPWDGTVEITMSASSDSKSGTWLLTITDGVDTLDSGGCASGDDWYVISCGGTGAAGNSCNAATGTVTWDSGSSGAGTTWWKIGTCTANSPWDRSPFTINSSCAGDAANDICSGFPGSIPIAITVNENFAPYWSTDLAATASVNVGSAITYTATATDRESQAYSLTVCTSSAFSAGYPATCTATQLCVDSSTASAAQATCDYTTDGSEGTSLTGYGVICDASSNCNTTTTSDTTTINYGRLSVNILAPTNETAVTQYNTFLLNATVNCTGAPCGTVYATARYNASSTSADENISNTNTTPLYINGSGGASTGTVYWRPSNHTFDRTTCETYSLDNPENATDRRYNDTQTFAYFYCDDGVGGDQLLYNYTFNLSNIIDEGQLVITMNFTDGGISAMTTINFFNYSDNSSEYGLINLGTDTPITTFIINLSKSNGLINNDGIVSMFVIHTLEGHTRIWDMHVTTTGGSTYDYWGVTNPSTTTNATYIASGGCAQQFCSGTELTSTNYGEINQSDDSYYTCAGGDGASAYVAFNIPVDEEPENIDELAIRMEASTTDTNSNFYFWNNSDSSYDKFSSLGVGVPDDDIGDITIFNSSIDDMVFDGYMNFIFFCGNVLSESLNIDLFNVNIVSLSSDPNPLSRTMSTGDSWAVNWTINATGSTNDKYRVDTLFNSSYGTALIPQNDTQDREICIGTCGEPPACDCSCPTINTNWEIDMACQCSIETDCNIGTGQITYTGTGFVNFDATINSSYRALPTANQIVYYNSTCLITAAGDIP